MFLKEILSREKHILNEIVDKKVCNSKLYERSYVRNLLPDSKTHYRIDNDKLFFVDIKPRNSFRYRPPKIKIRMKSATKRRRRNAQLSKRKSLRKPRSFKLTPKEKVKLVGRAWKYPISILTNRQKRQQYNRQGHSGCVSYTTSRIYKSRRSNFIRFKLAQFKVSPSNRFIDLFLKGIRTLMTGKIKERENSLILLNPEKGGFRCYSSGFLGFLPENQFFKMLRLVSKKNLSKNPFAFKAFIEYQEFRWYVSSPPRLRFVIKLFSKSFRFRRNKFVLSKKKSSRCRPTALIPKILFYSRISYIKKTRTQRTELKSWRKFDNFKRSIK